MSDPEIYTCFDQQRFREQVKQVVSNPNHLFQKIIHDYGFIQLLTINTENMDFDKIKTLAQLRKHLLRSSNVITLKEDRSFIVFLTKRHNGPNLGQVDVFYNLYGAIVHYTRDKYPIVDVLNNDEDYILCVLKPKEE